jgi:hypothetical protein
MRFRIGIHLGDVIETEGGDSARRRRQHRRAPAGDRGTGRYRGLGSVRGAVKTRIAARFDDLGLQRVKNIADPIRAFALRDPDAPAPSALLAAPDGRGDCDRDRRRGRCRLRRTTVSRASDRARPRESLQPRRSLHLQASRRLRCCRSTT